ncbi:MAG: hypothetical protein WDZ69_01655 [Candidatus Pacearchaeota archaeon]
MKYPKKHGGHKSNHGRANHSKNNTVHRGRHGARHGHTGNKMNTKTLAIAITIIFILIAASVVYILVSDREEQPNPTNVQCQNHCDSNSITAFCDVERRADENLIATCNELATNPDYARYGVQPCPAIDCEEEEETDNTCEGGLNSEWVDATSEGECPDREGEFVINREDERSDEPPTEGQVCCFYYD